MTGSVRASATTHLYNIQFADQGTIPATPAADQHRLYFTTEGIKWLDSDGEINTALEVQDLSVAKPSGDVYISLDGAAGSGRNIFIRSSGDARWAIYANNVAEGGSNAGSNLKITAFDDAGAYLGDALEIIRSSQAVKIPHQLEINGELKHTGSTVGFYNATPVSRQTYGAPTGTLNRAALTDSSSTTDVRNGLKALITDLRAQGLLG